VAFLGALLAVAAPGCGGEADEVPAAQAPAPVVVPQVRLDRPARAGPEAIAGPIPTFPGARSGEPLAWLEREGVSFEADAPPEAVLAFYREALLADGWALEGVTRIEGREILAMATASRRSPMPLRRVTVAAEPTPSGSRFVIFEWHAALDAGP
jgi:hypothetical protein